MHLAIVEILHQWKRQKEANIVISYCTCRGRNELASYLLQNGIYTTLRYHPLHMNSIYKQTDIQLPNSENQMKPLYPHHHIHTDR